MEGVGASGREGTVEARGVVEGARAIMHRRSCALPIAPPRRLPSPSLPAAPLSTPVSTPVASSFIFPPRLLVLSGVCLCGRGMDIFTPYRS